MNTTELVLGLVVALLGLGAAVYALTRSARQRRTGGQSRPEFRSAPVGSSAARGTSVAPSVLPSSSRAPGLTQHPIVLAHGWLGFDSIGIPGVRSDYFRGVRAYLEQHGQVVHVTRVPAFGSICRRAEALASELDRMGIQKANIIAHSMGGLDARYAISCLGLGNRVASLTTIGTPHRGTPLADTGLALDRWPLARQVFAGLTMHTDGILDLSTTRMAAFNERVVDVPGVSYACYVTWVHGGLRNVPTLLAPGYAYLRGRAGDNDGIVPASSQKWGHVLGELHADHWAQIGWSPGVDVRLFYRGIARMLARRGF